MHWPALRRINALDSLLRGVLGIPIHSGRDVLYVSEIERGRNFADRSSIPSIALFAQQPTTIGKKLILGRQASSGAPDDHTGGLSSDH
jgi:hypothetical protein